MDEAQAEADALKPKLQQLQICRCGLIWEKCAQATCDEPIRPWTEDFFESEEWLRY